MQKTDSLGRRNHGWTQPGPGRPNSGKIQTSVTFHTTIYIRDKLRDEARRQRTTVSELVRTYVVWGIEEEKKGRLL